MNKRGVTPVITTVLLVAIVLTLASIIVVSSMKLLDNLQDTSAREIVSGDCSEVYDFRIDACIDQSLIKLDIVNYMAELPIGTSLEIDNGAESIIQDLFLTESIPQGGAKHIDVPFVSTSPIEIQLLSPLKDDRGIEVLCSVIQPIKVEAC